MEIVEPVSVRSSARVRSCAQKDFAGHQACTASP